MENGVKDEACMGLDIIGVNQSEGMEVTGKFVDTQAMENGVKDEACVGLDIIGVNQSEGVEVTGTDRYKGKSVRKVSDKTKLCFASNGLQNERSLKDH